MRICREDRWRIRSFPRPLTLHFFDDDQIDGMQGSSGEVWYHGWHGDFVGMAGEH